jgi:hypothetical protein
MVEGKPLARKLAAQVWMMQHAKVPKIAIFHLLSTALIPPYLRITLHFFWSASPSMQWCLKKYNR